jgi:hypothetical protein
VARRGNRTGGASAWRRGARAPRRCRQAIAQPPSACGWDVTAACSGPAPG